MLIPSYLQKGDEIRIISTAKKISQQELEPTISLLTEWGYKVSLSNTIFQIDHQFAGTVEQRVNGLQEAINDPNVKAILCARGGYGTSQIIDFIDFSPLIKDPKWIIGFSDVTVLHSHLHTLGIASIHGIMPIFFNQKGNEHALTSLKTLLEGENYSFTIPAHPLNRLGTVTAPLIGGNLTILHTLLATPSDIDLEGKILFIEDLDEYLYHMDRMMVHLKRTNKLSKLAGLVVGHLSDMNDNPTPYGKNANEIVYDYVKEYDYPLCFNVPIGHEPDNRAVICGHSLSLSITNDSVSLSQKLREK